MVSGYNFLAVILAKAGIHFFQYVLDPPVKPTVGGTEPPEDDNIDLTHRN
jgi:hypothetical protein